MTKNWITVVETRAYLARAEKLMSLAEQQQVVDMVAKDPTCGVVLEGTGGIRKLRLGVGGRGKSGGVRVIYYFHSHFMPVFLLTVFAKNEKANLSRAERHQLAALVDGLVKHYRR